MGACDLCPRCCGVDRDTAVGYCKVKRGIRVGRAAPHMWEEPCLSGKNGSGTVFFCGCTLGCVYCQNADISRNGADHGVEVSVDGLAHTFLKLQAKGVHNINLVTPTMFAPDIAKAIRIAKARGLTLPIVYNTSGYERRETLSAIADEIDVYLPDFKYVSPELAAKYSHAADYPEFAAESLDMMVSRLGEAKFDGDGMMTRGVIVRHLLLPSHLDESKHVLEFLFSRYGNNIYYSIMSQYTPLPTLDASRYPELSRRVTTFEYMKLIDFAHSLGIENGFIQSRDSAKDSFIPAFNGEGV